MSASTIIRLALESVSVPIQFLLALKNHPAGIPLREAASSGDLFSIRTSPTLKVRGQRLEVRGNRVEVRG